MSNLNSSNTTTCDICMLDDQLRNILTIMIKVVSGLGVIFIVISLIILFNKTLTHRLYTMIRLRQLCNLIVCIFGIGFTNVTTTKKYYFWVVYEWFIISMPLRIVLLASGFADFYLIVNRYLVISNRTNFITKSSALVIFLAIYIVSIALNLPGMFAIGITPPDEDGMSNWYIRDFGYNMYYIIYILALFIFDTIAPPILLSVYGALSVRKFRQALALKARVSQQTTAAERKQNENRFTILIIILTLICAIYRTLDCLTGIVLRIGNFGIVNNSTEALHVIRICRDISHFLVFAAHAVDGAVIFMMDKNLIAIVKQLFTGRPLVSNIREIFLIFSIFHFIFSSY